MKKVLLVLIKAVSALTRNKSTFSPTSYSFDISTSQCIHLLQLADTATSNSKSKLKTANDKNSEKLFKKYLNN